MLGESRPMGAQEGQVASVPVSEEPIQTELQPQDNDVHSSVVSTGTACRRQWGRCFVYFLTLGVASAMLFTIFSRVPGVLHNPLPASEDTRDYRLASDSTPSVDTRLTPTPEGEQQEQPEDTEVHPADEEGKKPVSSVDTLPPSPNKHQLPLHDLWGLPMLDHFEETLPPEVKQGKEEIAAFLANGHLGEDLSSEEYSHEFSTIARALSNGSSESLVGLFVLLKGVRPLHWMENDGHRPHILRINRVLGRGTSAIVVEAEDMDTHDLFGMRIIRYSPANSAWQTVDESLVRELLRELEYEEEVVRQVCGTIPADMVASKKGVAVTLYTADIAGIPETQRAGKYILLSRVRLMERLYGAVIDLFEQAFDVVEKAKEYIARRAVQIVLKLQQAGLSHSDLKWDNMVLRPDGTILVTDMDSSLPFGSPYRRLTLFTVQYREPQLALRQDPEDYECGFKIPHSSSDLWSLGVLLYEVFTGETSPYGEVKVSDKENGERLLATWLINNNIRSSYLEPSLEAANVPTRWRELIKKLLEPNRRHRATSWEILEEFPDLVRNPE